MNSLEIPNTLSMYDTVSCVFVFVNLHDSRNQLEKIVYPEPRNVPPTVYVQQSGRLPTGHASCTGSQPPRVPQPLRQKRVTEELIDGDDLQEKPRARHAGNGIRLEAPAPGEEQAGPAALPDEVLREVEAHGPVAAA